MAEKTIKHASFWYTDLDGLHQVATRGETVDISEAADLKRGEQHGAFASEEDAEGSPLAAFIASREAAAPAASVMLDPADVESRTSIAGSADPAIQSGMVAPSGGSGPASGGDGQRPAVNASKADWVAYHVTQRPDDVDEGTARAEAEAMTKADLVARHAGQQSQADGPQG